FFCKRIVGRQVVESHRNVEKIRFHRRPRRRRLQRSWRWLRTLGAGFNGAKPREKNKAGDDETSGEQDSKMHLRFCRGARRMSIRQLKTRRSRFVGEAVSFPS